MYTHSYQSFIWNSIASERLAKHASDKPILGDLVLPVGDQRAEEVVDEDAAVAEATGDNDDSTNSAKKPRVEHAVVNSAVVVTEENIHQFSIYDVVLPLPGYDIMYPENSLKQRYEELLASDGIDFQSLHRATNSEYHLPGSFRHLLKRPEHVTHEIKRYDDPTVALLETDIDQLMKRKAQPSIPGGKYRALCLEFQLSKLMRCSGNLEVVMSLTERLLCL
jgi:tRNA pseudouridine13 synthase